MYPQFREPKRAGAKIKRRKKPSGQKVVGEFEVLDSFVARALETDDVTFSRGVVQTGFVLGRSL